MKDIKDVRNLLKEMEAIERIEGSICWFPYEEPESVLDKVLKSRVHWPEALTKHAASEFRKCIRGWLNQRQEELSEEGFVVE